MMRLAYVLALPLAVLLVVACGGGAEEPPDPDSFSDGLTAEEILERSNEARDDVHLFRIRESKSRDFLGIELSSITESVVAFENVYTVTDSESNIGDLHIEILYLDEAGYSRESADDNWETIEDLDVFLTIRSAVDESLRIVEPGDSQSVRLRDGEIDGMTMMRVRKNTTERSDTDALLNELCGELDEIECLPPSLIPNEMESEMIGWYGADDFLPYRLELDSVGRRDGEVVFELETVSEISDYGERIVMPNPLAN